MGWDTLWSVGTGVAIAQKIVQLPTTFLSGPLLRGRQGSFQRKISPRPLSFNFPLYPWPDSIVYHYPLVRPRGMEASDNVEISHRIIILLHAVIIAHALAGRTASLSGNDLERASNSRGHPPRPPPVTPSSEGGEVAGKGSPTLCHCMRLSELLLHHPREGVIVLSGGGGGRGGRPSEYDTSSSSSCKLSYGQMCIFAYLTSQAKPQTAFAIKSH